MKMMFLPIGCIMIGMAAAACSSSSDGGAGNADAGDQGSGDDAGTTSDSGENSAKDAGGRDAASAPSELHVDATEGQSCDDACSAQGHACAATCTFDDLDGTPKSPYAGAGHYIAQNCDPGGCVDLAPVMRFEPACDEPFYGVWYGDTDPDVSSARLDTSTAHAIQCCCGK